MTTRDLFGDVERTDGSATLEGTVESVVFGNPETAWSVIRLTDSDGRRQTAVGPLFGVQVGERLRLQGSWESDRKFGRQFRATSYLSVRPETVGGIERFLGSGLFPGIGKVMARRLVRHFGTESLKVIENEPERLSEVPGIGPGRARRIEEAWRTHSGLRDTMIFLQGHGISATYAARVHRQMGADAVARVRENPYRLAAEMVGIGFKTADRVAASLGLSPTSPERIAAGVRHVLGLAAGDGHLYLPRRRLTEQAARLLSVEPAAVEEAIRALAGRRELVLHALPGDGGEAVYRPELEEAEAGIASEARRLLGARGARGGLDAERSIAWFEGRSGVRLADRQREAVARALGAELLIVTGGPGTGKTTLVRAIVEILRREGRGVALAAPTGRAANRLAEATSSEARTIHRLLEFEPRRMRFRRDRERPIDADLLIVDEASMLDCDLTHRLLLAVPDGCRLVLVGDVDQLPSVGPGRVLADLIASSRVPVVRLERVFRQAARSRIVVNAHRILRGELPYLSPDGDRSDFFFIERRTPESVLSTLRRLVTERVPRGFGLDPRRDIQVLSPMRRGDLGSDHLNLELQQLLNPSGRPVAGSRRLRAGDRVMQIRNNYELEVFNGDIGRIAAVREERRLLHVDFEGRGVDYRFADLDQLTLAYACSVHKSQGSEYPCVILPVHSQHHIMLQRNLLYTAVTRGRRLVVLLGERRALAIAVRNARPRDRFSQLSRRLRDVR